MEKKSRLNHSNCVKLKELNVKMNSPRIEKKKANRYRGACGKYLLYKYMTINMPFFKNDFS